MEPTTIASEQDHLLVCRNSQGMEILATPVRIHRHQMVFEVYNPASVLQLSEVLNDLRLVLQGRTVYSGKAVVRNLVNTGTMVVCEVMLDDCWVHAEGLATPDSVASVQAGFGRFIEHWQKNYKVLPEYKIIIADMQSFLTELRLWLEQIELGIRSSPSADRVKLEQDLARQIGQSTTPALTALFEKFEAAAQKVPAELQPIHCAFVRRQLHPILLCAPFLYRTFTKPLGYAGDYEMVNMIARDPCEGGSLFAKVLNLWFLSQPPAEAHRNRIRYLSEKIALVTARAASVGKVARVLTVGCGPALEVQAFLREKDFSNKARFTLLDFNQETLVHGEGVIEELKRRFQRSTQVAYAKKSVTLNLKQADKRVERSSDTQYELVYCAGLYDYLSDQLCQRLSTILYDWVAPGGSLITTNVDASNPRRLTRSEEHT